MKPRWETTYERWFQACVVIINRQNVTTHKFFPTASTLTFQTQDNRVCCYYLRFVDFNLCLVRLWMNKNMHFYLSLYFKLITSHLLRDKNKSCHVGEQWSSRDVSVMFHHQGPFTACCVEMQTQVSAGGSKHAGWTRVRCWSLCEWKVL